MKLYPALICAVVLSSCGSDQEQREKLNQVPLTIDPPGGTFAYRPWVTVTKETLEEGTGNLVVRAPGDDAVGDALLGEGCRSPFYIHDANDKRQKRCVEVRRTGEVHYYLDTWFGGDSDVRGEYYTINTPTTNTEAAVTEPASKIPPTLALKETDTSCSSITFAEAPQLNVALTFDLPPMLHKQWRTSTLLLRIKDPKLSSKKATSEWELLPVAQSDDALPAVYGGLCTVTIKELEVGKVTHGTYDCSDLTRLYAFEDDPPLLGQGANLKGEWYCDGYSR